VAAVHTGSARDLILAEHGEPIGVGALAMPGHQRVALIELLQRYGRHHPTGVVMIPEDRIQATVHYTARTPPHGKPWSLGWSPSAQTALTLRPREVPLGPRHAGRDPSADAKS
jgi:hypothetical protein